MIGLFPTSVLAAKENFKSINHISIQNLTTPVPNNHPDFNVDPYSPGQYEIVHVKWYEGSNISAAGSDSDVKRR